MFFSLGNMLHLYTLSVGLPHECTTIAILAQASYASILNFVLKTCCFTEVISLAALCHSEVTSLAKPYYSEETSLVRSHCSGVTRPV